MKQSYFCYIDLVIDMEGGNERAKKNWGKLRDIIRSGAQAKKKKQYKFELFEKHMHTHQQILNTHYVLEDTHLLQRTPIPTVNQLLHFDSPIDATGKWVWQAEEVAAYYLMKKAETYMLDLAQQSENVRVLELGAGSSGLASIAFKIAIQKLGLAPVSIEITDGEMQNIAFLEQNLKLNGISAQTGRAKHMLWGDKQAIQNFNLKQDKKTYQMLIVCDCLFFEQFHKQLLLSIESYLSLSGLALLINPSRGHSLNNFIELAKTQNLESKQIYFQDKLYQTQVQRLRKSENFREDTDIPYIIELRRASKHAQK